MTKIEFLFKKKRISWISDLELERYVNFFENSYKDNLKHSEFVIQQFPRWSIMDNCVTYISFNRSYTDRKLQNKCGISYAVFYISGYYAMHDITKLFFVKKHRIKVDFKVHVTTIALLKELIKNKEILNLIKTGYKEFLNLALDLQEAKKERIKMQYYTGTKFLEEEYKTKALYFHQEIVIKYLEKIKELLK